MKYYKEIFLKDGRACILRSASAADGEGVWENFTLTHGETEYLLTYPDENSFDIAQEQDEIELCAVVDGHIAGTAGFEAVGRKDKIKHRAEFGISVEKA